MTPVDRPEADPALADKQVELARLRNEYLARFRSDPDVATFELDDAIAAMREALRRDRPMPVKDKARPKEWK